MDNGSTTVGWVLRMANMYVTTAEGQFINCQTPGSMRELRLGRDRGELACATRLWSGGRLAGVQRGTMGIIFYFTRFDSPFLALPSSPPPLISVPLSSHSFMPIRPSTRAHLYKDTWRSVDWDASGEAIIASVTRSYESCLNESTRARSVDTRAFPTRVLILYCSAVQRYSRDRRAIVGSY